MSETVKSVLLALTLLAVGALAYCNSRDWVESYPYQEQQGAP